MGRLERRLQKMRFHMIDSSQLASLQRTETKLLAHPRVPRTASRAGPDARSRLARRPFRWRGAPSTLDVKKWFA